MLHTPVCEFEDETSDALYKASEWGDSEVEAEDIVILLSRLITNDKASFLGEKRLYCWGDIEVGDISAALNECCIRMALPEDVYTPAIHSSGHEFEITLFG